ncbi:MAG: S41 family peptidase [Bacteroidota bacterium]
MFRFLFFLLLLTATSCQTLILGEPEANDPVNNYRLFREDFDRHYGLFTVRGWDWDSIRTVTEARVTPTTTDEELFAVFRDMVDYLDDSHTFVYWPQRDFFRGNSAEDERQEAEFSASLILRDHVDVIDSSSAEGFFYGRLRGRDIGYLYLAGMDIEDFSFGDHLLRDLGERAAIIIDLRNNTGGDDNMGAALAGRFADREELVYTVQERNGPRHDDFAGKTEYYLRPQGPVQFTKPVVVLTDGITVSAAEVFLFYLDPLPDVTRIGTPTSGDFSDTGMRRFLPNGMQYQYSIMKFLTPDGRSLDGAGHQPDIAVRNSAADIQAGNDVVLARAFRFLFEEYGIE